ncbi:DUF406 family protein [Parashewanella tropica]|uniref:DUF406 family protein n=1 Tax=Parashewanella tropica TaxID=2547970 RepID=UPI00105A91D8|nr:DUF406 family protein [Parashewanella tropica]
MKSIKRNQSLDVNDTCNTCGAFVDVGAVIGEDDKELIILFSGSSSEKEAQQMLEIATSQFDDVKYHIESNEDKTTLVLTFAVAVEKMLFQMQNKLAG